jgi:hypothetical protein
LRILLSSSTSIVCVVASNMAAAVLLFSSARIWGPEGLGGRGGGVEEVVVRVKDLINCSIGYFGLICLALYIPCIFIPCFISSAC